MNERIEIIERGGLSILYVDYSNFKPKEIIALVPEVREIQIAKKLNLMIFNVSNTHFNSETRDVGKESIKLVEGKIGKTHTAIFGMRGIQKIIANAVSRDVYFAKDFEDATAHLLELALLPKV